MLFSFLHVTVYLVLQILGGLTHLIRSRKVLVFQRWQLFLFIKSSSQSCFENNKVITMSESLFFLSLTISKYFIFFWIKSDFDCCYSSRWLSKLTLFVIKSCFSLTSSVALRATQFECFSSLNRTTNGVFFIGVSAPRFSVECLVYFVKDAIAF